MPSAPRKGLRGRPRMPFGCVFGRVWTRWLALWRSGLYMRPSNSVLSFTIWWHNSSFSPWFTQAHPYVTKACLERAPGSPRYSFKKAPRRPGDSLKRHQRAFRIVKYEVKCTSLQDGPAMLSYTCVQSCQFSSHFCTCARTLAVPVLAPRWPQDGNHIISNQK